MTKTRPHASRTALASRLLALTGALLLVQACSGQPGASDKSAAKTASKQDEAKQDEAEQGEAEQGESEAEDDSFSEVLEVELSTPEAAGNTVPVVTTERKKATVTWREVSSPAEAITFVYVTNGVLGRTASGYVELDEKDGQLFLRPDLEIPKGELIGRWPRDAWLVESSTVDGERRDRLLQFDGDNHWKPIVLDKKTSWPAADHSYRKGWKTGFLVREGSGVTRLGSHKIGPKVGPRMGKIVLDVFEATGGDVYHITQRTNGLYVQIRCENRRCVDDNAKKLPFGSDWKFGSQIPRLRNSTSLFASVAVDDTRAHYLLHYETGGWKLEALVHEPSGMWADGEGGLWVVVEDKLWYRTQSGSWYDIALPAGAGSISAAMRNDETELWLATTVEGKPRVFATAAVMKPE